MATPSLLTRAYEPLSLGAIRPLGWLADQLRVQANGLTGKLDEFWPDIGDSGWIGGEAEGWERGPYWLDGLIPLAFLLDDAELLCKADRWVDYILEHQRADGWLGPVQPAQRVYVGAIEEGSSQNEYDPWPTFVVLKALAQYFEATGDERIVPAMTRFLRRLDVLLDERPLFYPHSGFAHIAMTRWPELVVSIQWLYRRTGESWLLELADKAHAQGVDWRRHFDDFKTRAKVGIEEWSSITHVVNVAMAVKAPAIWYLQSQDPDDRAASGLAIEKLERYHGQATGVFSGDENLAGRSPSQGTELCAVVEYMFSLETLISTLGDPTFADRLEKIAYNALPGAFTADMWAHQYDQQANQVECVVGKHVWTNNPDDANTFGLEPCYGCCTANLHQGWPKFVAGLWMATPDAGLAAVCYGPCQVRATVGEGVSVTIEEVTNYPFDGTVRLTVLDIGQPTTFPLGLRIPGWADGAVVRAGSDVFHPEPQTFLSLERCWRSGDVVELVFPLELAAERRFNDSVSLSRGPLLFSLKIEEELKEIKSFGPSKDYEIRPTGPWNYGLEIDCDHPGDGAEVLSAPVPTLPFDPASPPVRVRIPARRVPQWTLELPYRDAAPPPQSPVGSAAPREMVTLIPYGSGHLRITEFPVID